MATFDFPWHKVAEDNPDSGVGVQFGNSYEFRAGPTAPLQRTFTITMQGMRVYTQSDGVTIDSTTNGTSGRKDNIMTLYAFWQTHKQHVPFVYNHPLHGAMNCRFKTPLRLPTPVDGGSGLYPNFEMQFIEVP